jgi:WD40 repeat protein
MADVFISYAREDQAAVRRLHQALADRGRETWVDWEGIAPSDEWLTSILEAIDTADAFVCVLSPDWAASTTCRLEADHAINAHKRLIPIVARELPEEADIPDAVRDLNWIFARSENEIDSAADEIVEALDTDVDAIRVHTLVHTRSRAWELAGRRQTTLLRGDELRRAEAWVVRAAAGTKPQPSGVQAAFIAASRAAARRRTRFAFGVVAGVAIISSVLAALALISRAQAIHEAQVARSHALTAESQATLTADPELSLLLAQQALARNNNAAARLAFVTAFDNTMVRKIVRWGGAGGANAVAWDPKAPLVAVAGDRGGVALWNPFTGAIVRRLVDGNFAADAVAFSPDGRLLASGGDDRAVHIWRVSDGRLLRTCKGHANVVDALAFSAQSDALVSGSEDGTARIWEVSSCREVGVLPDGGEVNGVAIAPGNRFIVTVDSDTGFTKLWDLRSTGWYVALSNRVPPSEAPIQVAISPNGKLIATSGKDGYLRVWDWRTGPSPTVFARTGALLVAVAFSPNGQDLAAGGNDDTARVWDVASRTLITTLRGNRGIVDGLAFSPDSSSLVTASSDGTARRFAVRASINAQRTAFGPGAPVIAAAFSPTQDMVVGSSPGKLVAWSDSGKRLWQRAVPGSFDLAPLVFDRRGTLLAGEYDGRVDIVRASDGRLERTIHTPSSVGLALSGNGSLVAVSGTGRIVHLYRTSTGELVSSWRIAQRVSPLLALAFSPNGRTLAVGTDVGKVLLLDVATGKVAGQLLGPSSPISAFAFSRDGTLLAGGGYDQRTWLWNIATRKVVRTFEGDTDTVDAVAISPSGTFLATGSLDHTARVWDLDTGDEVQLLSGNYDAVTGVGFTPDGRSVITSSLDGTLRVWDSCAWCLSPPALNAHAKPALARCLTPDELDVYLQEPNAKEQPCAA